MQSVYGAAEILKHHDQQQQLEQHQYDCCPSSLFIPFSSNNNNNVNNIPMTQQLLEDQSHLGSLQHTTLYCFQPQHYHYRPHSQRHHRLVDGSHDHRSSLSMLQCRWHPQEEDNPTIPVGESLWKPLNITNVGISNTIHSHSKPLLYSKEDHVRGCCNTSSQELVASTHHHHGGSKFSEEKVDKYRLFGELQEAIYSPAVGMNLGEETTHDQTGSGSALTGENSPAEENHCFAVFDKAAAVTSAGVEEVDHPRSQETQLAALRNHKMLKRNKKKKKKSRTTLNHRSSISVFLERLVKQLMEHQQGLHKKFLEALENMDRARVQREQEWRTQQMERFQLEETARAHERALASSRDEAIATYLERITNKTINQFHQPPNATNENISEEGKDP